MFHFLKEYETEARYAETQGHCFIWQLSVASSYPFVSY
jgi:hypothetical protein